MLVRFLIIKLPCYLISELPGAVIDFKALSITKDSIHIGWKKPISDGGSHISAYLLELQEGEEKYMELVKGKVMSHMMVELKEGKEYSYRVKAINESGEGPPSELTVIAKDQTGKSSSPVLIS